MAIEGNYYGDKSIKYYDIKVGTDTVNSYIVGSVNGDGLIAEKLPVGIDDLELDCSNGQAEIYVRLTYPVDYLPLYITGSGEYEDSSGETYGFDVDGGTTIEDDNEAWFVAHDAGREISWAYVDIEIWDENTNTMLFKGRLSY